MTILSSWKALIGAVVFSVAASAMWFETLGFNSRSLIVAGAFLAFMSFVVGAIYQGRCDMEGAAALRREQEADEAKRRRLEDRRARRAKEREQA